MYLERKFCYYCKTQLDLTTNEDYHIECRKEFRKFNSFNYLHKNWFLKRIQFALIGNHPIPFQYWKELIIQFSWKIKILIAIPYIILFIFLMATLSNFIQLCLQDSYHILYFFEVIISCLLFFLYLMYKIKLPEELK